MSDLDLDVERLKRGIDRLREDIASVLRVQVTHDAAIAELQREWMHQSGVQPKGDPDFPVTRKQRSA